jgi:hypothetical protein
MQSIIDDELSKPLEVTEDFMQRFEAEEADLKVKRGLNMKRHVASVEHLEGTLLKREAVAKEALVRR